MTYLNDNLVGNRKLVHIPFEDLAHCFREAAKLRNKLNEYGFHDNAGAIYSAERIYEIMGRNVRYPGQGNPTKKSYPKHPEAEFSEEGWKAYLEQRDDLRIEHVFPRRAATREAIERINSGVTDQELREFVHNHYQLVVITEEEQKKLDSHNRSEIRTDRLGEVGIKVIQKPN